MILLPLLLCRFKDKFTFQYPQRRKKFLIFSIFSPKESSTVKFIHLYFVSWLRHSNQINAFINPTLILLIFKKKRPSLKTAKVLSNAPK
jgi:hypothetical protein